MSKYYCTKCNKSFWHEDAFCKTCRSGEHVEDDAPESIDYDHEIDNAYSNFIDDEIL